MPLGSIGRLLDRLPTPPMPGNRGGPEGAGGPLLRGPGSPGLDLPGPLGRGLARGPDQVPPGIARQLGNFPGAPPPLPNATTPAPAPGMPTASPGAGGAAALPGAAPNATPGPPAHASHAPAGAAPGLAAPAAGSAAAPAATPSMTQLPATALSALASQVARTMNGQVPAMPVGTGQNVAPQGLAPAFSPVAAQRALQTPMVPHHAQAGQAQSASVPMTPATVVPAGLARAQAAGVPQSAVPATPTPVAPQASPSAPQAASSQPLSSAPVQQSALASTAARADVPPAAPAPTGDRTALLSRPGATQAAVPSQAAAAPQASTAAQSPAAGQSVVAGMPAGAVVLAATGAVEARGAPLAVADRPGHVQLEGMTGGYTADGPGRRTWRRRVNRLRTSMLQLLAQARRGGADQRARATYTLDALQGRRGAGAWFALPWLFWLLAVVAYGCLALALIALTPSAAVEVLPAGNPWVGRIALGVGLAAAAGSWWLARRSRR